MAVTVRIPAAIGEVFGAQRWEQVEAATVAALILALDQRFPGLGDRLTEPGGQLRRWINIFVDGADIRSLDNMSTPLPAGAEVYIVPSVAGGS